MMMHFCVYRLAIREHHEDDEGDSVLITFDLDYYRWYKLMMSIA
jgi:hypothetical protein